MKNELLITYVIIFLASAIAMADTQFDFTTGDLSATFGAGTLAYYNGTTTSDSVSFGKASGFGLPALSGGDADVMSFAAFAPDQGFLLDTASGPNGGSSGYINRYSMIWDILIPDVSGGSTTWTALYNTDATNSNDADFFISPDGGIGISYAYEETVLSNMWHRIAVVWDVDSMYKYIDGTLVGSQLGLSGLDGRWSLYPTSSEVDTFLLTDNNGDTNNGYLSSFYFTDTVLTVDYIATLGGPNADGIIPEPCTLSLLMLGGIALRRKRLPRK